MGEAPNSEFRKRLGMEKVMPFQHLPTQKEPMRYNPKMRAYTLNKSYIMNKYFDMIKTGNLLFPSWETSQKHLQDIRNIIIEYDEEKNSERYTNIGPDDFAHATLFGALAAIMSLDNLNTQQFLQ